MSENRRIVRAAGLVGALTLVSRITGLLRDAVTGYYFGAGPAADAFFVAFRLPNLLRRLVGEGATTAAFVPVFGAYLGEGRTREAERALRATAAVFGLALIGLTVLGVLLTPAWLVLLAPGFAAEPATRRLAERLARWMFPYALLISLVALYGGYLNAKRHFLAPALSPVLLNLAIIAAAFALTPSLGIASLVAGVLLGGTVQLGLQLLALRREGTAVTPIWEPSHPALGEIWRLLAPATLGTAMYQVNVLLSTSIATLLVPGSVSALWYAGRLLEFPIGLVAVALGTAALPSFADQAARQAQGEMRHSLSFAIALTNYVAIPASVALVILARPITAVLFQRGAFTAADVDLTALRSQAYAVGAVGAGAGARHRAGVLRAARSADADVGRRDCLRRQRGRQSRPGRHAAVRGRLDLRHGDRARRRCAPHCRPRPRRFGDGRVVLGDRERHAPRGADHAPPGRAGAGDDRGFARSCGDGGRGDGGAVGMERAARRLDITRGSGGRSGWRRSSRPAGGPSARWRCCWVDARSPRCVARLASVCGAGPSSRRVARQLVLGASRHGGRALSVRRPRRARAWRPATVLRARLETRRGHRAARWPAPTPCGGSAARSGRRRR